VKKKQIKDITMKNLKGIILAIALIATTANAGLFKITNRDCTNGGANCQAAFDQLETEFNSNLPDTDASKYLAGMANAGLQAAAGQSSDYANKFDVTLVALNVGLGVDVGDNDFSSFTDNSSDPEQLAGAGFTGSVQIGLNAGILPWDKIWGIELKKVDGFIKFAKFDLASANENLDAAELTSFGIMARYQVMEGYDLGGSLLKWGGVFVHTGFSYNSFKVAFKKEITETQTSGGVTASFDGFATVGADMSAFTIPIEVSTYVDMLYIFTVFGGAGVDINMGSSESIANINGDVAVTGGDSGTGTLDLGSDASPTGFQGRMFGGLQFNIWLLKLSLSASTNLGGDSNQYAFNLGTKVVF
jgi:hypothetical protein